MTIPSHFPQHWQNALAKGDATGFRTKGDMVSFFYKARSVTALYSEEERHYLSLADRHPEQYQAALSLGRADMRTEYEKTEAVKHAPFVGTPQPAAPTPAKRPKADTAAMWADAIEKVNSEFNGIAAKVYARRNGKK